MKLTYSSRAKDELAKVDWRIRESIILRIDTVCKSENPIQSIVQLKDENLYKVEAEGYILVGSLQEDTFTILNILEKQVIKLPTE